MLSEVEKKPEYSNAINKVSKNGFASDDSQIISKEKLSNFNIFHLLKIKSEPNFLEKQKILKMYDWESNANTVIKSVPKIENQTADSLKTEDCKTALENTSQDSSISEHWMSIVGRVNNEPLLEDEAVPDVEFYDSLDNNKFESFEYTVIEPEPKWRKVSDESFMRMEELVKSPARRNDMVMEPKKKNFLNASDNLISFSPLFKKSETVKYVDISKNYQSDSTETQSDGKYDTCESYESSTDDKHLQDTNIRYNSLEDADEYSNIKEENSKDHAESVMVKNSFCISENSDESLNFNDTLEEMEYLIKFGMKYSTKEKTLQSNENCNSSKSSSPSANITKKSLLSDNKENAFKLRSPRFVPPVYPSCDLSPFKFPSKTSGKKFFYQTPPKATRVTPARSTPTLLTPSKSAGSLKTPSKYDNILSPVQFYINNSPVVPKIKNVTPGINMWERQAQRAASNGECLKGVKETTPLQEKAYKSSLVTKLIETPPKQKLPKNFRVGIMAESLPKPTVIKHERREQTLAPLREQNQRDHSGKFSSRQVDESFANLPVKVGDISLCYKKSAVRTRTLK